MRRPVLRFALLSKLVPLAFALWLLAGCSTVGALLGNKVTFSAAQLQSQLDKRFPRDYDKLGGLVTLRVMHPRLTIPKEAAAQGSGRLHLEFDVGVGGLGLASDQVAGHLALESGLRFDPETRGLHLVDPSLVRADVPALGTMNAVTRGMLDQWLAEYARAEPVYRLDDNAWQRLSGRTIGDTTIGKGVVTLQLEH